MIKAIPWNYDGIPFRSKLEAKWFCVLKSLWSDVEYEPEVFKISQGYCWSESDENYVEASTKNYCPDFKAGQYYFEIKPLKNFYDVRDQASIWNAILLGYEKPTVCILGDPRSFSAFCCHTRYKGCPLGYWLDGNLEPDGEWYLSGMYPDEGARDPFPIRELLGNGTCESPLWRHAEKAIQWKGAKCS